MFIAHHMSQARSLVASVAIFLAVPAHADFYRALGLTYSSGFNDVVDWHEDNLPVVAEQNPIPLGVGFRMIWVTEQGVRVDAGIGPLALLLGDVSYTDIPLQLTLGYSFMRDSDITPYVRAGLIYHNISGDYVIDSESGGFTAIGVEFDHDDRLRFYVELSNDSSEVVLGTGGPETVIELGGPKLTVGIVF